MLSVFVVAMTMIPSLSFAAFEAPTPETKGTIKVLNVNDGATVKAYKIVGANIVDGKFTGWKQVFKGTPETVIADFTAPTAAEITALAKQVKNGATATEMTKPEGEDFYSADLDPGLYIIIAEDPAEGNTIYNPAIGAVNITDANTGAATGTDVDFNSKFTGEVYVKKTVNGFNKKIVDSNYNDHADFAQEGETVKFEIAGMKIPSYSAQYHQDSLVYKITDTLDAGFDAPKADKVIVTAGTAVKDTDYTVSVDGQVITVKFKPAFIKANAGTAVKVNYSAVINSSAKWNFNKNTNKAELEYTHKPGDTQDGTKKEEDKTYHYTIKISGVKVDSVETETKLEGAEFAIYTDAECKTPAFATATSNGQGEFVFSKLLDSKTYYIKETKAPAGYALNSHIYKLELTAKAPANDVTEIKSVLTDITDNNTVIKDGTIAAGSTEAANAVNIGMIKNTKLSDLPATGQKGMLILTVAGIAIMTFVAVRMRNRKEA